MSDSVLLDKIAGSIFGGAIGDAMGGPLEARDEAFIQTHYGGRVTTLAPYVAAGKGASNLAAEAGTYTDDTRLKNLLCQAIIEKGGRVSAEDLAEVWLREMNPKEFFFTEQLAYMKVAARERLARYSYTKEINPAITARDFGRGALPACDANMMISPVGLINALAPSQAALEAYEVSLLFQSGYAASSCQPIAAAVAEAMGPDATWESVLRAATQYADRYTRLFLDAALKSAEEADGSPETFKKLFYQRHLVHFVDPMEVVPAAFGVFAVCRGDFASTVVESANLGRDCDTIAGIAGSIAGALSGVEAIPDDWISTIKSANPVPDLDTQVAGLHNALSQELRSTRVRLDVLERQL